MPLYNPPGAAGSLTINDVIDALYPVGALYVSTDSTNPGTLLGRGTWSAFGAGRVMVGRDSGDTDFDTGEETGGAKTVTSTGSVAAPTISGSTGSEAAHTHSVTSNVTVADHAAHTHSVTSNVAVGDHAAHTHTFTQSSNAATPDLLTASAAGGAVAASGTTGNPNATMTHSVTNNAVTSGNPSATLTHTPTNNAVTSGAGSSHSHAVGTLANSAPTYTGNATSVVQPYIVVFMWKRTA